MKYRQLLLIDDDSDDQEIFQSALEHISTDIRCISFTNAVDALNSLIAGTISPDAIFLDMNMPIMSGHEFLIEVKKREEIPEIPVIVFSTSSNPTTIKLMKEMGAIEFLTKPNKFDLLVETLKSVIL